MWEMIYTLLLLAGLYGLSRLIGFLKDEEEGDYEEDYDDE